MSLFLINQELTCRKYVWQWILLDAQVPLAAMFTVDLFGFEACGFSPYVYHHAISLLIWFDQFLKFLGYFSLSQAP